MIRRRPLRVWLLWAIGAAVLLVCSLGVADPAILSLALDPELVALVVASGASMVRGWVRHACAVSESPPPSSPCSGAARRSTCGGRADARRR